MYRIKEYKVYGNIIYQPQRRYFLFFYNDISLPQLSYEDALKQIEIDKRVNKIFSDDKSYRVKKHSIK